MEQEATDHAWWRHPGIKLLIAMTLSVALAFVLGELFHLTIPPPRSDGAEFAVGAIVAAAFVALYVAFCRRIEHRPAVELGPRGAVAELAIGLATGAILFSAVVAVIWALGGYHVVGTHSAAVLVPALAMALASGFPEEIVFRGLFFRLFEEWLGTWWALAITSAAFGAAHLLNPGATWFAAVAIAFEGGIMLGAIYLITRRLWAAIGLHAAWNFAQGGIYGIAVSGGTFQGLLIPAPNYRISTLITGGQFGAEASLPAMAVATAFGLVLLLIAYRRGRFVAPLWVRRRGGAP